MGVGGSTIVVIEFVGVGNSDSISGSGVSGDDDSSRPPAELEYAEDDVLIRCGRLGANFDAVWPGSASDWLIFPVDRDDRPFLTL